MHGERAFNKCEPCVIKCTKLISLPIKLQLGEKNRTERHIFDAFHVSSSEGARSGCYVATCRVRGGSHETRQRVSKDVVEHGERSVDSTNSVQFGGVCTTTPTTKSDSCRPTRARPRAEKRAPQESPSVP